MRRHLRQAHDWQNGRACGRALALLILSEDDYCNVTIAPVCCQTFYQLSKFIRYFEVQHSSSAYPLPAIGRQIIEPREEGDELLPLPDSYTTSSLRLAYAETTAGRKRDRGEGPRLRSSSRSLPGPHLGRIRQANRANKGNYSAGRGQRIRPASCKQFRVSLWLDQSGYDEA